MNIKELKEYIKDLPDDMEINTKVYKERPKDVILMFGDRNGICFNLK